MLTRPAGTIPKVHPLTRWMSLLYLLPKRTWLKLRLSRTARVRVAGLELTVPPDVFNPVVFRTGRFFADFIAASTVCDPSRFVRGADSRALDLTTGSGVHALALARRGFRVAAVDINPSAVQAAANNVAANCASDRVDVFEGDLYAPVLGERFEIVTSSLPLFRGEPKGNFDLAWRSSDVIERFAEGLAASLTPDGMGLAVFTTDGDQDGFFRALEANGLTFTALAEKHFGNEIISIYAVGPGKLGSSLESNSSGPRVRIGPDIAAGQ